MFYIFIIFALLRNIKNIHLQTDFMPTLKKNTNTQKSRQINREQRTDIYRSKRWRELRLAYIMQHPLCEICLKLGITKPAEDVHHKDSFTNYSGNMQYSKAYDWSNLIALCKEHHSYLHRRGTTYGLDLGQVVKELSK